MQGQRGCRCIEFDSAQHEHIGMILVQVMSPCYRHRHYCAKGVRWWIKIGILLIS